MGAWVMNNAGWYDIRKIKRAALSHNVRMGQNRKREPRIFTSSDFNAEALNNLHLPTPLQQATNAIRVIGDEVSDNGEPVDSMRPEFSALIGAPSRAAAYEILEELKNLVPISMLSQRMMSDFVAQNLDLTLRGWGEYQKEQSPAIRQFWFYRLENPGFNS